MREEPKSPEELENHDKADQEDEDYKKMLDELAEEKKKIKPFKRMMVYLDPKYLLFVGIICSFAAGFNMPFLGLVISKLLGYLTSPFEFLRKMDPTWTGSGEEYLEQQVRFYSLIMAFVAVWTGVTIFF